MASTRRDCGIAATRADGRAELGARESRARLRREITPAYDESVLVSFGSMARRSVIREEGQPLERFDGREGQSLAYVQKERKVMILSSVRIYPHLGGLWGSLL